MLSAKPPRHKIRNRKRGRYRQVLCCKLCLNFRLETLGNKMGSNASILIVDDVLDNIQVAMNILKEEDYDFSFALSGEEALALLENESTASKLDLILLDIMMPGINGLEVCRIIKQNPGLQDIPVIFLTAKVEVESISQGFAHGAVDYITKPFHAEELLARVKTHVDLYHATKLLKKYNINLGTKIVQQQRRLLTELEENQREMIIVITELMEATSDETGKHIHRVAEMSALLAKLHPSMTKKDEDILFYASPMHDVGKMMIPPEILHMPRRYTEEEFQIMKAHTTRAYQFLKRSERKLMKAAAIIAHEHHEKWNGKGYPRQLQGTDIHIYGRIVALVDVFDALTHQRCYKKAWSIEDVIVYIREHRATQFDPELVDILMEHLNEFKAIAKME